MIKYTHGSEDSLDIDVFYVFDNLPSFKECQDFCSNKDENRNIIVVKDGIVTECFKGTPDEINNGLLQTYHLHKQNYENIVTRCVERDKLLKTIRVIRCLISHCSRTQHREEVKRVLRSNSWKERLEFLFKVDLTKIDDYGKNNSKKDIYKIFAFQLGQIIALLNNKEYYTKSSIAGRYSELKPFLYREDNVDVEDLNIVLESFLYVANSFIVTQHDDYVYFHDYDRKFNLRKEIYI